MKEIKLSQGKIALVDDEDFDYLNQWRWYAGKMGNTYYVSRNDKCKDNECGGSVLLMHRIIMKPPPGMHIDHVNHNGLDNCKENLRICTKSQNNKNRLPNNNKQYKGITLHKCGKYQAVYNRKYIGLYENKEDALIAYNDYSLKLNGEFAYLNKLQP